MLNLRPHHSPLAKWLLWFIGFVVIIIGTGFALPEARHMPVEGAHPRDWNAQSFWYYPWGRNRVHKGIDIFAKKNTPALAATHGIVLFQGVNSLGGNVVLLLGSKWRLHYYAHLETIHTQRWQWVSAGQPIGLVGDSGNARGKAPHLHYSIVSLFPLPWHATDQIQGHQRMFYLDPGAWILGKL